MKVLLDTNILVRSGQPHHAHCVLANESVRRLTLSGHQTCLTPQVLYEFWAVATRPLGENGLNMNVEQASTQLMELQQNHTVLYDGRSILATWFDVVNRYAVKGKTSHDARLVASMIVHQVESLLTFNESDLKRYDAISVITPENAASFPSSL